MKLLTLSNTTDATGERWFDLRFLVGRHRSLFLIGFCPNFKAYLSSCHFFVQAFDLHGLLSLEASISRFSLMVSLLSLN